VQEIDINVSFETSKEENTIVYWEPIISLAEGVSVTSQKLRLGVNITIELKNIVNKSDSTGTLFIRNTPRWIPLLSDIFFTLLSSIVVLTPNEQFLECANLAFI
jgi:hypothetical protein